MCPKLERLHHMHGVLRTQRHRATGVLAGEYDWGRIQIADYVRRYAPGTVLWISAVSYTHLTLPTNREV